MAIPSKRLIFVADDEPMQLKIMVRSLEDEELEVVPFACGEDLLEGVRRRLPDVIITDLMMPGLSGTELCARIKTDSRTRRIPVLVVSSINREGDILEAFKNGAVDYMVKPVRGTELRAKVKVYLSVVPREVHQEASAASMLEAIPTGMDACADVEFGKLTIHRKMAEGGTGAVYQAYQHDLKRVVAVKVLKEGLCQNETAAKRFFREMRTLAAICHSNVVQVFDVGQIMGLYYMSMELIKGQPLDEHVHAVSINQRDFCRIFMQLASALGALHEEGLIHRDVKPKNIMMTDDGEPYLIDFGLARKLEPDEDLTQDGLAYGTPLYMAPEQIRDNTEWDHRADFYSLGLTMYKVLTGHHPFDVRGANTLENLFHRHLNESPVPPSEMNPELARGWNTVIMKLVSKDPSGRFQSSKQLETALWGLRETLP